MAFSDNETSSASYSSLYADIFERSLLVARAQSVLPNLAVYFGDKMGIEDRKATQRASVSIDSVDEDEALPVTEVTKELIATLTPSEAGGAVLLTERALRTDPNIAADVARDLGGALAQKLDEDLCGAFSAFEQDDIGDEDDVFSVEHIEVAAAVLRADKKYGELVCVMDERQWFSIRNDLRIDKSPTNASEVIKDELARGAYMGSLGGVRLVVTPHVPKVEGAAPGDPTTAVAGLFVANAALALDMRQAPKYDTLWKGGRTRVTEYSIYADYAAGVWRPDHGVPITTSAPAPAIDRS